MELKRTWYASETGASESAAKPRLVAVSRPALEAMPTFERNAPQAPPPAKRDRILAYFDWLCSGPVSEWEREMTRRARWRLA